ncbi:unnamed protein product [Parnassius apollo]|uniref:(apollo) hypothetical protein n=1 Tax=Parnassius apollo TaxID=110799 RepID=A0A8S3W9M4_PARAO|nr:unnamed protein product [Parnassius apollo]
MSNAISRDMSSIERAPSGYVDPDTWDHDSVLRLLGMLQRSEGAAPVLQHLRRTMFSRRFMSFRDTFKAFPSLSKDHVNYLYYEVDSEEYFTETTTDLPDEITDDSIIVISNPTEARLPAAQISVKLLREILEARAVAARQIPTTRWTIRWKPMNKTTSTTPVGGVTDEGSRSSVVTSAGPAGSEVIVTSDNTSAAAATEVTSPPS